MFRMQRISLSARLALCFSLIGVVAVGSPASAVARSVTASSNVGTTSANGGGSFTITSSVPVAAPGTVSQSITTSFDPTRAQVTGSSGIVAPSGWTLSYSSDGTTFGAAPGTPSGWAAIRAVRATGSIASGGDAAGLQIATGSGTATVPPSGAFNAGGGGDGWDVSFDEQGNVYNVFHHDGYWGSGFITPGLHCHTRSGATCGPGWPFALRIPSGTTGPDGITGQPWYHTNDQAMSWVDVTNNRVWIETNLNDGTVASGTGYVCVDVSNLASGPAWCGGSIRNAFVKTGNTLCGRDCNVGLAFADNKLFSWDTGTGKLACLDPYANRAGGLPGAPCANQPFAFTGISSAALGSYSLITAQGYVWGSAGTKAICFDPTSLAACSGWSSGPATLSGTAPNIAIDIPASNGDPGAVCYALFEASRGCFNANGSTNTELTGSHAGTAFMTYFSTHQSQQIQQKSPVTNGTRIIWSDGRWPGGGQVNCYDTSLSSGAGAACANFPVNHSAYTATLDAQNINCIWTNTDSGTIATIDAVTGGSTCTTPPSVAEFSAPVIVPRLACSSASSIQSWRTFKLTSPAASTYSTATLTVLTSSGAIIPGWNRISITGANRSVDLSSLAVSTSGLSPRFKVALANKTTTDLIGGEVTVVGGAPELCVPLQAVAWCPSGPQRIAGALSAPAAIQVTTTGEAQPQSGPTEVFTNSVASVSVSAPSDASCLGTLAGTATMASNSAAVPNALMRLVSSSGTVLATTTTDAQGNYTFDRLIAGSNYRVEFGPSTQGAANAATVSSTSTNRTVTANATTTVNGVYALLRTNVLSGNGAHGQAVSVIPAPNDSTGAQSYTAFTKSATCVIDPADNQCKATVVIAGEGTWAANATSGALTFTPNSGYIGTTTAVAYRVTETSSSLTTWNLASVVIAAPVTTTTTTTTTTPPTTTTTIPATSSVVVAAGAVARAASTGVLVSQVRVTTPGRVTQTGTVVINGVSVPAVVCTPVTVASSQSVNVSCTLTGAVRRMLATSNATISVVTQVKTKSGKVITTKTKVILRKSGILPVTK